jgi:8-oxo-dGTP pyrophosphatase MutT (NUDIX family)
MSSQELSHVIRGLGQPIGVPREAGFSPQRWSLSVAGVVKGARESVLAVRRNDNGAWEPPGGIVETGETIEEALIREVEEETGYQVVPVRLTGVYQNLSAFVIALVFQCSLVGGSPRPSTETDEVSWLSLQDAASLMSDAFATRVLDAWRFDIPPVRWHDGHRIIGSVDQQGRLTPP